ncbi:DUF2281 domain-containing protein [Hymenobacter gummosus]|uniref:DUF2281 domain-containing protein n=1 Tax=Hymenobacter gummosus TaxID=1776032 RepID=A0A3S0JC34_9BACT|nr:DUF2281 domain-containing protein [Hymenobacter gummosus]RTQ51670.1 DUF2281 domain-containing protein [Hymenobacter gummosus]
MTAAHLLRTYEALPPELQREATDFIEFLLLKWQQQLGQPLPSGSDSSPKSEPELAKIAAGRRATLGALKGQIWLAPDFDEPLDDFKDYM